MRDNEKSCMELNELIYQISDVFWKKENRVLLKKQEGYSCKSDAPLKQTVTLFRKGLKKIAEENKLTYSSFSHNQHLYFSLTPWPIYVGLDENSGIFSISVPHIPTKQFDFSEYEKGLLWIQDFINVDDTPVKEKIEKVYDTFYLNRKTGEIVAASIKSICLSTLKEKSPDFEIKQTRLYSRIIIPQRKGEEGKEGHYIIDVYHKPFSKDAASLINLLKNPQEIEIPDFLVCEYTDHLDVEEEMSGLIWSD